MNTGAATNKIKIQTVSGIVLWDQEPYKCIVTSQGNNCVPKAEVQSLATNNNRKSFRRG
jgi:hypothetical protein